ncbi:DNA repair protein complementing XP-C cells [Nymphon striatum]|nr:DNA repair protein complementing XP-C cells [Nymphon striatum]
MPTLRKRKVKENNVDAPSKKLKATKIKKNRRNEIPDSDDSFGNESSSESNIYIDPDQTESDADTDEEFYVRSKKRKKSLKRNKININGKSHDVKLNSKLKADNIRHWNNLSESDSSDGEVNAKGRSNSIANTNVAVITEVDLDIQVKENDQVAKENFTIKTESEKVSDSDNDFQNSCEQKNLKYLRKNVPKCQSANKISRIKKSDATKKSNHLKSVKRNLSSANVSKIDIPGEKKDECASTSLSPQNKIPKQVKILQDVSISQLLPKKRENNSDIFQDNSSDDNEWEEVDESKDIGSYNPIIPQDGIDIMLALPAELQKKSRTKKSYEELFRDYCNMLKRRIVKRNHLNLHKVNLLCLIGRSFYVTDVTFSLLTKGLVMSIIPKDIQKLSHKFNLKNVNLILSWLHSQFQITDLNDSETLEEVFLSSFSTFKVPANVFVYFFAALVSYLGLECRIVFSYQPVPIKDYKKAPNPFLTKNLRCSVSSQSCSKTRDIKNTVLSNSNIKNTSKLKKVEALPKNQVKSNQLLASIEKSSRKVKTKCKKLDDVNGHSSDENTFNSSKTRKRSKRQEDSDSKNVNKKISKARKSTRKHHQIKNVDDSSFDDSDFEIPTSKSKSTQKKHQIQDKLQNQKLFVDEWVEIYIPVEKRWVCVDSVNNIVNEENVMEKNCSGSMSYVVAFDKNKKCKDVTARYASGWLNATPKLRLDWYCGPEWWEKTLQPYAMAGKKVKEEDKQLQKKSMEMPLPKSFSEYKHHKLYALARNLLKFEAIYPPDAPPLGFIRGETIYARECVYTLYSRDHWVQQARTVKIGETPYKIVKARPGFKKTPENENRTLDLFGTWQTEVYDPPAAENGKVPRNAYGNVELFKPEMLPKGTKHLTEMPGLIRIAKKLNIDCAQAMVGWDFKKGRNVPMMDGWVVCNEHEEILTIAWEEEQVNIRKREEECPRLPITSYWPSGLVTFERW